LDGRENDWKTAELMDQVYDKKNAASGKASIHSGVQQVQDTENKPVIFVGKSKLAILMDSDDDEEVEEEEELESFDGRSVIREWIIDNELSDKYEAKYISQLIRGLIVGSLKEMDKALTIFAELKSKNIFEKEQTLSALVSIVAEFSDEVNKKDFPLALSYAAAVLATLINNKDAAIDDYQKVFVTPNIKCASTFLDKVDDDVLDQIAENQWWIDLHWRPEDCSAVTVLKSIPERAYSLFELYDNLNACWELFEDKEKKPQEIIESIQTETPENVLDMPEFAVGTIEILLSIDDEALFSEILPIFKKFDIEILGFVEKYGKSKGLNDEKLAQYLKSLADTGRYNIAKFKEQKVGENSSLAAHL